MMKCVSSLRAQAINGKMFFLHVAAGAHVPKVAVYGCDCNDLPLVESGRRKMNVAVSRELNPEKDFQTKKNTLPLFLR